MLKIFTLLFALSAPFIACATGAADHAAASDKTVAQTDYKKVIDDYKAYLTTVDKNVREEIVTFRKEVARLNKQKHKAYKLLSQEAQHFLAKEKEFKRKLPKEERKGLNDVDTE